MIESIEKLRREIEILRDNNIDTDELAMIADAIEREVEERYVELPRDKSGAPIHVGDKVRTKLGSTYTVDRIRREDYNGTTTWYIEDFASHHSLGPEDLTLCKPPTVEDVLNGLCLKYVKLWNGEASKRERREIVAEYAAKLELRKEAE